MSDYVCSECVSEVYAKGFKFSNCKKCDERFLAMIFPVSYFCHTCCTEFKICKHCGKKLNNID